MGRPLILAVAPNGARKLKADHPAIPLTPAELGREAAACREAGAAMIHLHVRDAKGGHTLDAQTYRDATAAIRREAGADMIVQATSEAVGIYTPAEQGAMVRTLKPEAVSLALRELAPTPAEEGEFASLLAFCAREGIAPQFILYDGSDVARLAALMQRGLIPFARPFVLYVLGRYSAGQRSDPPDLLPFLTAAGSAQWDWSVCAFGPTESACALTAACLGGHARLGFENNTALADGAAAPDNASLLRQFTGALAPAGRRVATASEAREMLGMAQR